jgi:O-antigen ligase
MSRKREMENKLFTIFIIAFLFVIYACELITSFWGSSGSISFLKIGPLAIPSLGLFVVICFLAAWRHYFYFLFLFFIVLAFPAPIDDLFPSVLLTNVDDKVQVVFPLLTRIDLYLLLGIILKLFQKPFKIRVIKAPLLLKIFFLIFVVVFVVNAFKSEDLWDFNLLLAYSFHIRYFILILLLVHLYNINQYKKQLVLGFVISVIFLFLEANINTYIKGSDRLLSGSLSLNTFANISAAIALYMIFLLKYKQLGRGLGIVTLLIAFLIIIGAGTRAAFLTLIAAYFLIYFMANHKKIIINSLKILGAVFLLGLTYFIASNNQYLPERYSYQQIADKITIDFSESTLSKIIEVKYSEETTSIKSRIDLFESSLNMIDKNPLTGIGAGRWNRYKNKYSETQNIPKVLLDTHNDYLGLMSQYGVVLGLLFAWIVFLYPFYLFRRTRGTINSSLMHLYVINFAMGVAALSNAGFFKHQVSALLLFVVCSTIKLHMEDGKA